MIVVRRDQIAAIEARALRRRAAELEAEARSERDQASETGDAGDAGDQRGELFADARQDAANCGFDTPALFERYVTLMRSLTPASYQSAWGGMLVAVLTDPQREPADRLRFAEDYLAPRLAAVPDDGVQRVEEVIE